MKTMKKLPKDKIIELIEKWQLESCELTNQIGLIEDAIEIAQIVSVRNRLNIAIIELQNIING